MLKIRQPTGIFPSINPTELAVTAATKALNCRFTGMDCGPWSDALAVYSLPQINAGTKTIYRWGENLVSDTQYWCASDKVLHFVRGAVAGDTRERTFFTGDGAPKYFDNQNIANVTNNPTATFILGIPVPTTAMLPVNVSVTGVGSGTAESRLYYYTFVNDDGDEGPPSAVPRDGSGNVVFSATVQVGQTVTLNNLSNPPGGAYRFSASSYKKIYRQVSGGQLLYVGRTAAITTTTFVDNVLANNLGDAILSLAWDAPPATLQGLTALPNGGMAAFTGRDLYFCEPYRPHAWPGEYVLTFNEPITGLAVFEQTLVVLTTSIPYLVNGSDPRNMVPTPLQGFPQSCVSIRSIVSNIAGGVVYASPDGLAYIGPGGPRLLTAAQFTAKRWQADYKPDSIHAYQYDGKYVAYYINGATQAGFIVDVGDQRAPFSPITQYATAGYNDRVRDALYVQIGNSICKFDAASTFMGSGYDWESKHLELGTPQAPRIGRVRAQAYPVTFRLWIDGTLKYTRTVTSNKTFTIPPIARGTVWRVGLAGTNNWQEVALAQDRQTLKAA